MPDAWIVSSKLVPPALPSDALSRALLPRGAALPPWLLLVAGPGYGKTLGLLSLLAPRRAAGVPVFWYSLDDYDSDVATFFHYVVAGMRAHVPQFGEEIKALLTSDRLDPRLLWQRFFQGLAAYNLPEILLVFDDVHHLQASCPEVLKALAYFFDKLPQGCHVLLSSRVRLDLPVGRAQVQGHVRLVTEDVLRFTSEEEVEFMRRRAPNGQIPNVWWKKATGLDGWPLGLDLATAVDTEREIHLNPRAVGVEPLTDYVAEELYGAQTEARRRFMRQAALLNELTPEACRQIFKVEEAADWLAQLEAAHLVRRLADGLSYRFPTYLRDFLLAESERADARDARVSWHQQAATYFAHHPELAFPHWIAAQAWPQAIALCEQAFPLMRFSGRQAQIQRWLTEFPAQVVAEEPVLQLWRGHVLSRAGQQMEAVVYYERAGQQFKARTDPAGVFKVRVRQATIALLHEELREAANQTLGELGALPAGRDEDVADLHLAHSLNCEQAGELEAMARHNQAVLKIPVADNIELAASHCIAQLNLYTIALHRGELETAAAHIAGAIELAETWSFGPYLLFSRFMQAHLRLLCGDTEGAGAFLRQLPTSWTDELDWHDLACSYATVGLWHQMRSEFKEAEDSLRKSSETFDRAGNPEGKKVALERQLWLWLVRRQIERILETMPRLEAQTDALIYNLVLLPPLARALHLEGDRARALQFWQRAVAGFETQSAYLHLARALFYQAATQAALGDEAAALAAVQRALELAERYHYAFLLGADQSLWDELAPLLPRLQRGVDFLRAAGLEVTAPAVTQDTPVSVKPTRRGQREVLTQTRGRLTVRCFGTMEIRLDGVLLDQWPRRKAKLVLASLLLYPRGLLLPQMIEVLGGDEVTQAAVTTIKVDVSALRRALEPALTKGQTSQYVLTHEERYSVAWDTVEYLDVRAFEEAIRQGDQLRDASPTEAVTAYDEALRHYRGSLLDDGIFARFFEAEREQFRQQAAGVLLWQAAHFKSEGDFTRSEHYLKRAIEVAPTEEDVYVALMQLQREVGRPERIRQVYWDCRKALKAHLGLAPSEGFEAAYAAVAQGGS